MAIASPRKTARNFRVAPEDFYGDVDTMMRDGDAKPVLWQMIEWVRNIAQVVNGTQAGKTNNVGTFTVGTSQASTTLIDRRISAKTVVHFHATTANAATEVATLYQTYPNATKGQAVINHANSAVADRTFAYTLFG